MIPAAAALAASRVTIASGPPAASMNAAMVVRI
jgi:hypothetical protein